MSEQIVVIGGGPGGIAGARTAASAGRPVALVTEGPVGGRAGWHSLLPSKVWLAAAEEAHSCGTSVDLQVLLEELARVKRVWNETAERGLRDAGVRIEHGVAVFSGTDQLGIQNDAGETVATYAGATVIAAPGSVPIFPPQLKPDGRRVLAPRFLSHLGMLPESMLVIGAGPTGCEAVYLFNALGVHVTWVVDQFGVLPQIHPAAGEFLGQALAQQGVRMVAGQMVTRLDRDDGSVTAVLMDGARYEAEMAFVAVGRRPDWSRLNLEAAGLEADERGRYHVDLFGRTANPKLYLIGDADGEWMIANKALNQGRIAALHAAGLPTPPYDAGLTIQPTYTEPQVAQVGQVTPGEEVAVVRVPFGASLKAHLVPEGAGFLLLTYDLKDGRVLGAVAVGPGAADVLAPVVVALRLNGRVSDLAGLYGAYPSLGELPFIAARAAG